MKALGLIFSNIHDKELAELTARRTLASVPIAGRFMLIDFILSNMVNGGVAKIGIVAKKHYQSLMDHIGSGKSWDLSRKNGGVFVLPPYSVTGSSLYTTRFDAIRNASSFIRNSTEKYLVMSDCDTICNLDVSEVLEQHVATGADMTAVCVKRDLDELNKKARFAIEMDYSGKITKTVLSDSLKGEKYIYTNMLIMERALLISILDEAEGARLSGVGHENSTLYEILSLYDKYKIYGYVFDGYFACIENISDYFMHSLDLLDEKTRQNLFYRNGNHIYTRVRDSSPCKITGEGKIINSIVADGCLIEGTVKNSILFRDVQVAKGAVVENSIVFQDTKIGMNSKLNCVILDKEVRILEGRVLSGHETRPFLIAKGITV